MTTAESRFISAFGTNRMDLLPMYIGLIQGGDTHGDAVNTIRGELLMASFRR